MMSPPRSSAPNWNRSKQGKNGSGLRRSATWWPISVSGDFASVHVVRQYEQTTSLSVTCGLPGDLYRFPLTLAVPLPSGWVHATAMQNNKPVWQQWHDESRMLYLDAVPNGGDVVLRSD